MSDHMLPDLLHVVLFADGQPFAGGWVLVHLGTTKKNSHGLLAGPTDGEGRIDVSGRRIEERVRIELQTSPMDFGGLGAWDGLINIEPLTGEAARGVIEAIRVWDDLGSIETKENFQRFNSFREKLEQLSGAELTVTASCEPRDAATVTTSVRRA